MNYRNILKVYKLERELAPDDLALLNTLRGMSDAERELLAESLGPPAKTSKPAIKKLKQCGTCGISKRAAHHRDVDHPQYHVFDEGGSKGKSKRAAGIAEQLDKSIQSQLRVTGTDLCTYELDGKVCKGSENDGIHDPAMGYGGYHEFQSAESAQAATGD